MAKQVMQEEVEQVREVTILNTPFNVYGDVDNPLFLAVDIAEMIEYSVDKTHQMLDLVDENEKLTDTIYRGGQKREVWFVTEYGLYELLMQSRKPRAKLFKLEVKKVLRQLRVGELRLVRAQQVNKNLVIEGAQIIFRNFSGAESKFNKEGDRNFCVVLDQDLALRLMDDGWNIKMLKQREEDEEQRYYVQVTVRFDNFPPKIVMVTGNSNMILTEDTVKTLDYAEIANVDLTINPSNWSLPGGKSGIKAYLKNMYVTIEHDPLAGKYEDLLAEPDDLPF